MTGKPDNPFAFPVSGDEPPWQNGMTLRDWFAGQALSTVLTICQNDTLRGANYPVYCATQAYDIADAMLTERERAK